MKWDIGVELGTDTAWVVTGKNGLERQEKSRIAFLDGNDTPVACGQKAAQMDGKNCQGMRVVSPLRDGTLESNLYADRFLRYLYERAGMLNYGKRFSVMITCASFARPVQREALLMAATDAGAQEACLVRCDLAAALGAGIPADAPEGRLLLDIGAGKITCTLLTMGRAASFGYLPYGLSRADQEIVQRVRCQYGYRIGYRTARDLRHIMGSALEKEKAETMKTLITGFRTDTRLPENFEVNSDIIVESCAGIIREITGLCESVIRSAPEEIAADLNDTGILAAGGGAQIAGLETRLHEDIGLPCRIADSPEDCAAIGLFEIMKDPDRYANMIIAQCHKGMYR